jgi:hypothetical protein
MSVQLSAAASTAAALLPSAPRFVPVTVTGRQGGYVSRLRPDDVGVIEDGVRQRVTSLERWPLWLVIVLDVARQVGPMKQLSIHRTLVNDLLSAIGEDDHVALVQYADGVELVQGWTTDPEEARESLDARFESGLDGQLWESVTFANQLLEGRLGHRMILVITDGIDDTSHTITFQRATTHILETGTTLHVVNLSRYLEEQIRKQAYGAAGVINIIQSPSYIGRRRELRDYRERIGDAPPKLKAAVDESGGRLWDVQPVDDPAKLPQRIWDEIAGQYMAAYEPERPVDRPSVQRIRNVSAFATRTDIVARAPARLHSPIVPPRSASPGTHLKKR